MDCKLFVEVSLLDLRTNLERPMPPIQLPPTFAAFAAPVIGGNIWAANVAWRVQNADVAGYMAVLLVNWKANKFLLLLSPVRLVHKGTR
jgi:hypothetical protein